ncbi:LytTR family DNA-binding domain-containing protein [Telmatobacter sp. DSM 110680]|uniref:LytTR family DNA-binding domain-containing protein n=1 Tax=Telmatobacter sp. DSM 110680 TaxID=3036704 RepID=A0AAU7DRJ8_9BACT
MTLRALIVDDEALARTALVRLLKRERDVNLIGQCDDGESAVQTIRQAQPDIVFLDVQMPEMDGFQVVEAVGVDRMPVTIFVTAFDRYAIRAFDANAVDYLLKPFAPDRLTRALARARERCLGRQDKEAAQRLFALLDSRLQTDYAQRLAVATGGRIMFVAVADIDWIEAEGNYARLHVSRKVFDVRETLQALMEKLDPREFIRIHRSTIVNARRIREVQPWFQGSHIVVLQSGEELRMSRYQRDAVERLLGKRA